MKCPKCGSSSVGYVVSRKKYWKQKSAKGTKPRTDFRAKCKKCGYEFDTKEVYGNAVVSQVKTKEPEKKRQIKMKYNEGD